MMSKYSRYETALVIIIVLATTAFLVYQQKSYIRKCDAKLELMEKELGEIKQVLHLTDSSK